MLFTSIYAAAFLECFCQSRQQSQQSRCSLQEFLMPFLPMLSLIGILIISLLYTEKYVVLRRVLKRVVHYSNRHNSLVDVYCYKRASHSATVISFSTIHAIWRAIVNVTYTSMMDFSITTLQIMTRRGQLKPVKVDPLEKCRKYDEHCKQWIDYRILRLVLMEQKGGDPDHRLPYKFDESLSLNERQHFYIETLLQYFFNSENSNGFKKLISCLEMSLHKPSFFTLVITVC